jgi:phage terminase large subunit
MSIRDRINSVNSKLCNALGLRGVIINPKCKNLISSLSKQTYKEGTVLPDKTQGFDHMNDAFGYMISFLYPIVKIVEHETPQRYTVQTGVNNGRI